MVELPGSLERATLGDVLGALHRDKISGALCLEEFGREGHRHVIHWIDGLIHQVETTRPVSLRSAGGGVAERHVAAARSMCASEEQQELSLRLEALFRLTRARISFRVMGRRAAPNDRPLGPEAFLHGRARKRDSERAQRTTPPPPPARLETPRALALQTLGLSNDADGDAVRAAFRRLARQWHPDLHPSADERTRAAVSRRFVEISTAYRELMAESA